MSKSLRFLLVCCLVATGTGLFSGCQMLPHALQPEQLWKLNRGPALGRDTYNFSVPPQKIDVEQRSYSRIE